MKWERVEPDIDLWRFEVPGGWLYSLGSSTAAAFVPRPIGTGERVEALVVAARAAQALITKLDKDAREKTRPDYSKGSVCPSCFTYPCHNDCLLLDARLRVNGALA